MFGPVAHNRGRKLIAAIQRIIERKSETSLSDVIAFRHIMNGDADGSKDSELAAQYIEQFTEYYESKGYTVERLGAVLSRLANTRSRFISP